MKSKRARLKGAKGGAVAGFLTALCVIPLPTFFGAFKSQIVANSDILSALWAGLRYSVVTFSFVEALALPLSAVVGYLSAR